MATNFKGIIAQVRINDGAKLTVKQRRRIALWLRRVGTALEREGSNYAPRFNARYYR